jgi:hypothetical protein
MAVNLKLFRQDDFTGGLNFRADQFQLAPNESPSMLNVEIDPRGGISSRGGMVKLVTNPILGNSYFVGSTLATEDLLTLVTEDSTDLRYVSLDLTVESSSVWNPENLFSFRSTAAHYLMLSTGFANAVEGTVYSSTGGNFSSQGLPVTNEFGAQFAPWGSILYITGGTGWNNISWTAPGTWSFVTPSGTSTFGTNVDQMPRARFNATHAGKMFVANTSESDSGGTFINYPNRIRWSDENNPLRWTATNFIDINDGGQNITGIASFNGTLIVFKEQSTYVILGYNSDNFQVVQLSANIGTVSPRTFVVTEQGIYFLHWPDGLYFYSGKQIVDMFQNIRPIIQKSRVNSAALSKVSVSYINNRVWVSLPYSETSSVLDETVSFVHDPTLGSGSWTMFNTSDGYGIAGGLTFVNIDNTVVHAAIHPKVDSVFKVDVYDTQTDNFVGESEGFSSYYRTRWIDGGNYSQNKMFRRPDFVLKQATTARDINVGVYHDYEEAVGSEQRRFVLAVPPSGTGLIWGLSNWGDSVWGTNNAGAFVKTAQNMGLARSVQMQIDGPSGKSWGMDSFTIKYVPRRVRG